MPILQINGMKEFIRLAEQLNTEKLFYQPDKHGWQRHFVYFETQANLVLLHHKGDPFEVAVQANLPLEQKQHEEISLGSHLRIFLWHILGQ